MGDKLWCVYLEWSEGSFIELFSIIGAHKRRIPGKRDLNYTHYSLEVEDLKAFREAIIARGGAKYIETPIVKGMDNALQMWMHDPDGNRFELMKATLLGQSVIPVKEVYDRMGADSYTGTFAIEYIRPKEACCSRGEHSNHLRGYLEYLSK